MVGYTIHKVVDTVDAGEIIYQEVMQIKSEDSDQTIFKRCEDSGSKKILEIVDLIEKTGNEIPVIEQDLSVGKEYRGVPTPKQQYELAKLMETESWQDVMVRK
jgi:methionyl-tRNA formyltransferase